LKNYQVLFILKPDHEPEELKGLYQSLQDNIKKYGGEIENAEEQGKKPLAFKIGKHAEGVYYFVKFKIEPAQIAALNSDFRLNELIIRVMVTVE